MIYRTPSIEAEDERIANLARVDAAIKAAHENGECVACVRWELTDALQCEIHGEEAQHRAKQAQVVADLRFTGRGNG